MSVKLLTEHLLEFLSLKGGCTGSLECTLVKMPHCWKSYVKAHLPLFGVLPLVQLQHGKIVSVNKRMFVFLTILDVGKKN